MHCVKLLQKCLYLYVVVRVYNVEKDKSWLESSTLC